MRWRTLRQTLFFAALAAPLAAAATTVEVISVGAGRAELIVNGQTVRQLRVGQVSPEGVELVSQERDRALLGIDGQRYDLGLGERNHPSVTLRADARGHFVATVAVNGRPTQMLVDTGASAIALSADEAGRLGVAYRGGRTVRIQTAGGPVDAYAVRLATVRIGGIALSDVEALVMPPASGLPIGLLGMSFLNRVEMVRSQGTLILTRRQ